MSTSTTVNAGAEQAQAFTCGTATLAPTQEEQRSPAIVPGLITAVSHDRVEVYVAVKGVSGGTIEAQWPDGRWASIGTVRDTSDLLNPDVPANYLVDSQHIRLRIQGFPNSEVTLPINPIITSLSSSLNSDGSVAVTGTTTLMDGIVEAASDGQWKGIGIVAAGRFSNPNVPAGYLFTANTMQVRVRNDVVASVDIGSTLGYPHIRSVLVYPTMSAAEDARLMDWRLAKADYHPTGYFAPAGGTVEIWAWGNIENVTVLVGVAGMADRNDPTQEPPNVRATRLGRGLNLIRDPRGGSIHIRNLQGSAPGAARIVFRSGAVPIPYYIKGFTTATQWRDMLNGSDAPEVELVGTQVVVAAFRDTALQFIDVDPSDIVESHELVIRLEAEVAGLDGSSPVHDAGRLRLYAVETSGFKFPHASGGGYIGLPRRPEPSMYSEALVGGLAANRWVTLHEYGHHLQTTANSFGPFGEVTNNVYAFAVNRLTPNEYTEEFPQRWPATQQWLRLPRPEKHYGAADSDAQAMFEQLRKGLGEGFLPAWHRHMRENPDQPKGLKWFVVSACVAARHDLTNFFADWGLLKPEHTDIRAAVAALNLPYPSVLLATIRPYVD